LAEIRRTAIFALSCLLSLGGCWAASQDAESKRAPADVFADTALDSEFWRGVPGVFATGDTHGVAVPGYKMEVRSRWTPDNLYFLFICPYENLYLKPNPSRTTETFSLWDWDVAEVFIGSDFKDIRKYKEFEVSPQGEWIDLDIDRGDPRNGLGGKWNSGFEVSARVDSNARVWYAFMKIPYSSVDSRPAAAENILRVNFFLSVGPPGKHKLVAWRPTGQPTFHVPEAFGVLKLVD